MGLAARKSSRLPPASSVRVPSSAAGVLPEMATSITSMPTLAPSLCSSRELSGEIVLISSTTVPGRAPAKNSLRARINALNCFIVGQARENHIGSPCQFKNVLRNDAALYSNGLRLSGVQIVYGELVSMIEQPFCDPASHVTQA